MMEKTDVLVIGGSAAGVVAAATGKFFHPDKDVLMVRKEKTAMIPCGIPYIFSTVGSTEKNIFPPAMAEKAGVRIKYDEVLSINKDEKTAVTADGTNIRYEKLIIATGSLPKKPRSLPGVDLEGVFTIPKNKEYLDSIQQYLKDKKKVIVVGGGFIGVEVSDELNKAGLEVTLVEILPNILNLAFDKELAVRAEELLKERGIKVVTGTGVKEMIGQDQKVTGVQLTNGTSLDTDAVILSVGYAPNTSLAKEAGLKLNDCGFIVVDEYMRTPTPDIMAVGDCAEKRDFITRKTTGVMLASTACAEGRIAGMNLYKLSALKTFSGTIAIYSTALDNHGFGTAGLTEAQAIAEGFDVVSGTFEAPDRHPGCLPGMHNQLVKLIVAKDSGVVIGGEVIGGSSTGELTNILGFIIQNKMNLNAVLTAQIGTQPMLTASPAVYPLTKAAENAMKKMMNL
ncbi:MAG: FAD-dependent oxidoreductase [Fidelibacterota bacterium]